MPLLKAERMSPWSSVFGGICLGLASCCNDFVVGFFIIFEIEDGFEKIGDSY